MSQVKAKGSTGVKHKTKTKVDRQVAGRASSGPAGKNNLLPLLIIGASLMVLIVYIAMQSSSAPGTNNTAQPTNAINQTTPTLPPMTGVEVFNIGTIDKSKSRVATYKMDELNGTDCVQQIITELKKCGTIGNVRADYSNRLLEVECDKATVTDDKIIAAIKAANHPGKLTTEKIAAK